MQKIFSILAISIVLFAAVAPAAGGVFALSQQSPEPAAVFDLQAQEPLTEPYWYCENGAGGHVANCPAERQSTPEMLVEYSGGYQGGLGRYHIICSTVDCPTLAYYVYVKLDYSYTYPGDAHVGTMNMLFVFHAWHNYYYSESVTCSVAPGATCSGTIWLPIKKAKFNWDGSTKVIDINLYRQSGGAYWGYYGPSLTYELELSFVNPSCDDRVTIVETVLPETDIDETIQIPLGPDDPETPDMQKVEITAGNMYRLETSDGPWRNAEASATDLYTTQISLDEGATWIDLTDFIPANYEFVSCAEAKVPEPDLRIVIFTAPPGTVSLMIRAGPDVNENWLDNWLPELKPLTYRVDLVGEFATACSPFYTFDPEADLLNSGSIPAEVSTGIDVTINFPAGLISASTGQPFSHPFIAIETGPIGWREGGETTDRFAALGGWPALYGQSTPHKNFTIGDDDAEPVVDGSAECVETIEGGGFRIFVQVPNTSLLNLRVRDINSNYSDNTGALDYRIYLVERLRSNEACESSFEFSNDSWSGIVDAQAENGKKIGSVTMPSTGAWNDFKIGSWYALDTELGPWYGPGVGHGTNPSFSMQISLGTAAGPLTWHDLDDWADAHCVVNLDTMGHVRVYFQVPNTLLGGADGARAYYLRVADTDFGGNRGSMGYKISRLVEISPDWDGEVCSGYGYDLNSKVADISIPATASSGVPGNFTAGFNWWEWYITFVDWLEPEYGNEEYGNFNDGEYYLLFVDGGPWFEDPGSMSLYDIEISSNNGDSWYSPQTHPAVLCAESTNPAGFKIFIKHQAGEQWRFRVASTMFSDNSGNQHITVYPANPDGNIAGACLSGAELFWLGTYIVDPRREDGILLPADNFVTGEVYAIAIDSGYWLDGGNPFGLQYFTLDMSIDNGENWELFHEHSAIGCFKYISRPLLLGGMARYKQETGNIIRLRAANGTPDTDGDWSNNDMGVVVKVYAVTNADDSDIDDIPEIGLPMNDACMQVPVRPSSILDVSGWVMYGFDSFRIYIAWCPRHNAALQAMFSLFGQYEPFATLIGLATFYDTTKAELDSYNWSNSDSTSAIGGSDAATSAAADKILSQQGGDSPWQTGRITIQGGGSSFGTQCNSALKPYLGQHLADPYCFAGNMLRSVGVAVWFQVLVDIIAVLSFLSWAAIRVVKPAFT